MIHVKNSASGNYARIVLLALIVSGLCCVVGCDPVPPEYKAFFRLSPEEQHLEMKRFPVDKQIDYYLAGRSYHHAPLIGLGDDIAEQGKKALPVLMKRLREEKNENNENNENNEANLMYVFEVMHAFHYDLKTEKETIELLKDVTARMKYAAFKERAEETLQAILEDKPADPKAVLDQMNKSSLKNGPR